jgi:hypothetical protein
VIVEYLENRQMENIGRILFIAGIAMAIAGAALWLGLGKDWLGKLPGDIRVERGGFGFFFPVITCILISLVLTILLNIFRR